MADNNINPGLRASQEAAPEVTGSDVEAIKHLNEAYVALTGELSKAVVGQREVIEEVLIAIFSRGHGLLIGVPGLAKTLMVSSIASVLNLTFKRIQFTPDLMPADITGTDILEEDHTTGRRFFRFVQGPIFANMVLADEINRTPPKTQAALLEAMQEHHVTIGDKTYPLPEPFFVLATQNPIEQEGTYPLPEAQLDRFMFNIMVDYPSPEEELEIMKMMTSSYFPSLSRTLSAADILKLQEIVRKVPVAEHVYLYARNLVRATRPNTPEASDYVKDLVQWGAGPRACLYLILGGKARAILDGRYHVTTDDVVAVANAVLRHRIITTFNAEAEGIRSDQIIARLVKELPRREEELVGNP